MAINFPGPYEVRIAYTTGARSHVQKLNLDLLGSPTPGLAFTGYTVDSKDGTDVSLDTFVDAWVALITPFFNSGDSTIDYAELWAYEPLSFNGDFYSSYTIGEAGTSGTARKPASELIFTFRTSEGGSMRLHFEDVIYTAGDKVGYSSLDTPQGALVDYVLSDDNPVLARDTSYPFAFRNAFPGQNERAFKEIYRS